MKQKELVKKVNEYILAIFAGIFVLISMTSTMISFPLPPSYLLIEICLVFVAMAITMLLSYAIIIAFIKPAK